MANIEDNEQAVAHPDIRLETTDVNSHGVIWAGVTLIVAVWIIVALLHFVFAFFAHYRAEASTPALPLASEQNRLPPEPRLQVSPDADIQALREHEDSILDHYTWVDRQNGVVGIPIQRAMDLLAARGIPPQKAPADLNLSAPTAGTRLTGLEGKVQPEP